MKTPRILLVNQDSMLRVLDEAPLRAAGYETQCAASGAQAMAMLAGGGIDLVITDRNRQGLDGVGLVRAMRAAGHRIPVMMLSVWAAEDAELPEDVREEFAVTLSRPASRYVLLAAVSLALRWSHSSKATAGPFHPAAPDHTALPRGPHRYRLRPSQGQTLPQGIEQTQTSFMKTNIAIHSSSKRAFISAQLAIVLGAIALGGGALGYEWKKAHPAAAHHHAAAHHRHHHHAATGASS
jgi:DNA-binding response OmpR family regulator